MTPYTAGYRKDGKRLDPGAFFDALPQGAILVDIRAHRYSPGLAGYCGCPTPVRVFGRRGRWTVLQTYRWLPELGNASRQLPPSYPDRDRGMALLEQLLRTFQQVTVFCACESAEACHRSHVAEETRRRMPGLEVIHL